MPAEVSEIGCDGARRKLDCEWIAEEPVALEFNGLSYAVMMASPWDLEDFARGFALTECLAADASSIGEVTVAQVPNGWIVRSQLAGLGIEKLAARVRTRVAESSCGLCGVENLEAVSHPLPKIAQPFRPEHKAVFRALAGLRELQLHNKRTSAAHAAAFATPEGQILCVREDVGRHNAVDKLIGAMAGQMQPVDANGFFVSTARCSYEIVEKIVRVGGRALVTVSLPTSMAVARAREARLSLYCLARDDSFLEVVPV